jgi:CubicO group peptidase (beta-lactamase class C family)
VDTGRIEGTVAVVAAEAGVPGLSIAVTDHEGLLFSGARGFQDRGSGAVAHKATRYRWFSMTKLVTATAAVQLADRGVLDLDAPVSRHLPCWPARNTSSVRQLLSHTAGLANPLPIGWVHLAGTAGPDQSEMLERLVHRRGLVSSGNQHRARYSNLGYLAAAEVISRSTGTPFTEHVERELLRPLGMASTGFDHPAEDAATGYLNIPGLLVPVVKKMLPDGLLGESHNGIRSFNPFLVDGAGYGGLIGSATDGARFLRMHLNDGELDGTRVLSATAALQMRQFVARGRTFDHAVGWFRDRAHGPAGQWYWEHYGTGAGYWNVARVYPDRGVGIVIMTNSTRRFDFDRIMTTITKDHLT